ncbi:hypothetical protein A6F68_01488 [Tsuneonella dongtanensis]|uniref:Uncharacterized protein n=1 Tax=Tsuneonella dongtanensis TaxID=692370 RepID=A0A1B2AD02_9SPHN|nr:hypothetical protein [Tsuneonella dongtanensis]ANY20004.1 hypothetical protein A6F68_01488 [Tsuneonella dongtanensis]
MTENGSPPRNVQLFESISIVVLAWDLIIDSGMTLDDLIWVPLYLWLVLSISRKRSSTARLILTGMFVASLIFVAGILTIAPSEAFSQITARHWTLGLIGWFLGGLQLWLAWSRPTTEWLLGREIVR